jgi:hypothetical protein
MELFSEWDRQGGIVNHERDFEPDLVLFDHIAPLLQVQSRK